jgi:phage terminase large subunit GpA-like protein
MLSRRLLGLDEVDRMPQSAGDEGDPVALAETRTKTFWNRKIFAGSTPTIEGVSRIAELFEAGDRRRFYVPCPHCAHMDFLAFRPRPDGRGHAMSWPDDRPDLACFECSGCHLPIEERDKEAMIEAGEWRAEGELVPRAPGTRIHASFSIWTAYSTSPNAGWGQIATEFIEAKRLGNEKLRVFVNTVLGETWQERGEAPPWEGLYRRREPYPVGTVPAGVIVLTCGVDVQKDRLVPEVVGWGANKESWSIWIDEIHGDTALLTGDASPWVKLDELLDRSFPGDDGRIFTIAKLAVDGGWQTTDANTQVVYTWGRMHDRSRVMVTKGVPGAGALVETATPVDVTTAGKKIQRGYRVFPIHVDMAKGELYSWLRLEHTEGDPPPGYCHFPEHPPEYFKQLTAEHLMTVVNRKTKVRKLQWERFPNRENHYLDARVLARVAAALLGIDRLAQVPRAPAGSGAPAPQAAPAAAPIVESTRAPAAPRSSFWNRPRGSGSGRGNWLGRRR